jgi:spore coat protein U-like protein
LRGPRGASAGGNTMKWRIVVSVVLGLLPLAGVYAQQQETSTSFRVTAKVEEACDVAASDLTFDPSKAQRQASLAQAPLRLLARCTPHSTYKIGLNESRLPGATVDQQRMVMASQMLIDQVTGIGTGLAVNHALFGAVAAAQFVSAGDYANTVTVRIYY